MVFNRKLGGRYRYLRESAIMASGHASAYERALDGLFGAYSELLDPTIAAVRARTPRDERTSERAYASATRAKACDLLRGLLPMATLTNVSLFSNGRAFEYLLTKLYAAPLVELGGIAADMQRARRADPLVCEACEVDRITVRILTQLVQLRGSEEQFLSRIRSQITIYAR